MQNPIQESPEYQQRNHSVRQRKKRDFTAGKAKKLMPINEQIAAINFPAYDEGTLSPYPTLRKRKSIEEVFFFSLTVQRVI